MKPQWVTDLEEEACDCAVCSACKGRDRMFRPFWDDGREEDFEPCFQCGGNGIEEECDRCLMLKDYDMETA